MGPCLTKPRDNRNQLRRSVAHITLRTRQNPQNPHGFISRVAGDEGVRRASQASAVRSVDRQTLQRPQLSTSSCPADPAHFLSPRHQDDHGALSVQRPSQRAGPSPPAPRPDLLPRHPIGCRCSRCQPELYHYDGATRKRELWSGPCEEGCQCALCHQRRRDRG